MCGLSAAIACVPTTALAGVAAGAGEAAGATGAPAGPLRDATTTAESPINTIVLATAMAMPRRPRRSLVNGTTQPLASSLRVNP